MAKILIIEDDRKLVDDLQFLIRDEGHECVGCRSEADVMAIWDKLATFDKIILDLMMKRGETVKILPSEESLDGGEIIFNKIRRDYPGKAFIIVTAKNRHDIQIDLSSKSIVKVFYKPLTELKIAELLRLL